MSSIFVLDNSSIAKNRGRIVSIGGKRQSSMGASVNEDISQYDTSISARMDEEQYYGNPVTTPTPEGGGFNNGFDSGFSHP